MWLLLGLCLDISIMPFSLPLKHLLSMLPFHCFPFRGALLCRVCAASVCLFVESLLLLLFFELRISSPPPLLLLLLLLLILYQRLSLGSKQFFADEEAQASKGLGLRFVCLLELEILFGCERSEFEGVCAVVLLLGGFVCVWRWRGLGYVCCETLLA